MRLYDKPSAIYAEISKMKRAEDNRREDRGTVSNFFNGAPPITDQEAEDLGLTVNVNHLFGYTELADAKDQMFGLLTKPSSQFEVSIDASLPGKRLDWEAFVREKATTVLRKLRSFKTAYEGCAGDASLHGEALFFHGTRTYPLPRQAPLSKVLVPDSATTDIQELTHLAIEEDLPIHKLAQMWRESADGWKKDALGAHLKPFYKDCQGQDGKTLDAENWEEQEYKRQENSATNGTRSLTVAVYYFYQKRCDRRGDPWDLDILVKSKEDLVSGDDRTGKCLLFQRESFYDNAKQFLHPMFMDCILGGAPKWHRVLGTGTLNYQLAVATELLINRAMQATLEGSMNLWQAKNGVNREDIQRILMKHNGVLPEGIELIQNRFEPNFGGILDMIQFFRQQGSKNARGVTPNNGGANDQLEVQAMFEQNLGANRVNTRTSNWYDYMDAMWEETWARLTNPFLDNSDPGASIIREFQAAVESKGIPLFWLQPENTQIRAVRIVGDGLRSKEVGIAQFLSQNRNQYAPEVQPKITRLVTGLMLDNHRLAEELTPIREEAETTPEEEIAQDENSRMMTQRKPIQPKASDIDELHVMAHFPALETLISDGLQYQKSAFTPPQAEAFQIIGGHIMAHIKRIEGKAENNRKDSERDKARQFTEQLNQFAAMGDKLLNNMQQAQEGQGQEIDPVDQAKLQMEFDKLQLQREKLALSVEKWNRTQQFRENTRSFDEMLKLDKAHQDSRKTERELALRDVEVATKVQTASRANAKQSE